MTDLFDFQQRRRNFAVLGNPVAHSKSPQIHEAFARQCGISLSYEAIALDPGIFEQGVRNLRAGGIVGANVTVPFKQAAWHLADELTDRAQVAQAVNTLSFVADDIIRGDNTDGVGLMRDLQRNLGFSCAQTRVLVIGAGGATRGIFQPLIDSDPDEIVIANRTPSKAHELLAAFDSPRRAAACHLEDLSVSTFDLVINVTAASLTGEVPKLPDGIFAPDALAYDLAYADQPTIFLRWALDAGAARAVDGLGMLVEQAAESFWVWHQHRPQTAPVISTLRSGSH